MVETKTWQHCKDHVVLTDGNKRLLKKGTEESPLQKLFRGSLGKLATGYALCQVLVEMEIEGEQHVRQASRSQIREQVRPVHG